MKWHELPGETPPKGERPEMNKEHYERVLAMHGSLIDEQQQEIQKLKSKLNQVRLAVSSLRKKYEALQSLQATYRGER